VICSILRFRYVDGLTQTDDFFWNAVNISTWSTIECGASIIAGCLATLRPFLKRLVSSARNSSALNTCVKHVSRSFRSSQPSETSSIPHYNSGSSEVKDGSTRDKTREDDSTFAEFLARPGGDVIALSKQSEQRGEAVERIVHSPDDGLDLPWPGKPNDKKRQTIHASWTLRKGVASDGRTAQADAASPHGCA